MNAKLTKVVAMASLAAFLTVGIGANVAQAKDYHFKIGENHRMEKNDDEREKHDKNATAKRSERHQRSESTNG